MDYQKKIKNVNLIFLVNILINLSASILLTILAMFGIDMFAGSLTFQLTFSQVIFVVPAALYLIFFLKDYSVLRLKKISFVNILLCIVLYACLSPVLTFLNLLSQLYSHNAISEVMYSISDEVPFLLGVFIIAIIPAFFEEATYRGLFYNTYREKFPLGAIILSGLTFGLMHGNLNQFTYAFVLGAVFALLVEATDSLWSSFTVHCLINMISAVTLYALPKLLDFLNALYEEAVLAGDEMTLSFLEGAFGSTDMSMEGIMSAGTQLTNADLIAMLPTYAVSAAVGGALAFFLFRAIAKRCGRWEHIRSIFSKKEKLETKAPVRYTVGDEIPEGVALNDVPLTPVSEPRTKLITWELVAGGVIMIIMMVSTELLYTMASKL